jgi:transcription elongation factor Elf1
MRPRTARSAQSVATSLRRLRSALAVEPRAEQPRLENPSLSRCVHCHKDFVVPVQWEPVGAERWWMFLRCAECGISREVTVTNAVADAYDDELARGARAVALAVHRIDLQQMAGEATAFAHALRQGLIEPADFAR